MNLAPSLEVSFRSLPPAEPPAIGVMGGRESLSTHMGKPPVGVGSSTSAGRIVYSPARSSMTTTAALGVLLAVLLFLTAYPMAMLVYGSLHIMLFGEIGTFSLDGYCAM